MASPSTLPKTMRAVKVLGPSQAEIQDVSLSELRNHEILVKVQAVALNPVDWKSLDNTPVPGSTLGCDFTGTVAAIGSEVGKPWHLNDRVLAWIPGNNIVRPDNGAFAEFCAVDSELAIRVPGEWSVEEAASPAAGIATAGMGVWKGHGAPLPGEEGGEAFKGETILVYGGTSATGTLAVQMGKLSGMNVITTCSPTATERLLSLGAAKVFDYHSPTCAEDIGAHTNNSLTRIFDTISAGTSPGICLAAMGEDGGVISSTLPYPEDRSRKAEVNVQMLFTLGISGEEVGYGESVFSPDMEGYEYAKRLYAVMEKLLAEERCRCILRRSLERG